MTSETITLRISSTSNKIKVTKLVEVLSNFQNAMFSVAEYLDGKSPRKSGDFSKRIRDNCEFQVVDLQTGSAIVTLMAPEPEQKILGKEPLGQRSLQLTSELIEDIASEEYAKKIKVRIPDAHNRKKILEAIKSVIPASNDYYVDYKYQTINQKLGLAQRERIEEIIPTIELPNSEKITGRLMELRVDGNRKFQVDTPEGIKKLEYAPSLEEFFKKNIGRLVRLEVKLQQKNRKSGLIVNEQSNYSTLDYYPLSDFSVNNQPKIFSKPLELKVDFEEDAYIMYEPVFGLLTNKDSFGEGVSDLKSQLEILWKEYVETKEELSPGAKALKEKLVSMVS